MQKPKLKLLLAVAFILLALGLSRRLWDRHRELLRTDSEIQALCQSLLDPDADAEQRYLNAALLRPFADPKSEVGSAQMRGLAQIFEAAFILSNCSGLQGDLRAAFLREAEGYLTLARASRDAQVAGSAGKGLSLLPQLLKAEMEPEAVLEGLEAAKLVPPPLPGSHLPRNREVSLAIRNQDSRKFADEKEIRAEGDPSAPSAFNPPYFDGGGAKLLFEGLGKQYGLRFNPVGEIPRRRHYAPPLREFGLFESKDHPLTGLSGDAVTQEDALLQIAFRVKLPGTRPEQSAAAQALFNESLKYFEEAKALHFMDWIAQKERVALMEPAHPFYAQMTVETTLITLRYRPGEPDVSCASFSADFEEQSYFQWLLAQLPTDNYRAGK